MVFLTLVKFVKFEFARTAYQIRQMNREIKQRRATEIVANLVGILSQNDRDRRVMRAVDFGSTKIEMMKKDHRVSCAQKIETAIGRERGREREINQVVEVAGETEMEGWIEVVAEATATAAEVTATVAEVTATAAEVTAIVAGVMVMAEEVTATEAEVTDMVVEVTATMAEVMAATEEVIEMDGTILMKKMVGQRPFMI